MSAWQAAALAISIFNAIICLWLGLTVWLDGDATRGPRLAATGLLTAGIFFLIHAAIVSRGPPLDGVGLPFWWRVISVPSLLAPYAWYATMIWYTGVSGPALRIHQWLLVILGMFIGVLVVLLTAIYPLPPELRTFALRIVPAWLVAGLPFLIAGYLLTLIICFGLPIQALLAGPGRDHFPRQAWLRVRMWLVRTSLLGLLAGIIALGGAVAVFALGDTPPPSPMPDWRHSGLPALFLKLDVAVLVVVAAALVAAGQAVGAYAAFTQRPLPQWNRIDQWRWLLGIAALFALIVGLSEAAGLPSIYTLLFATTLAALAYALLSWRYRVEHEAFMDRLRPFVSSLHFQDRLLDGGASLHAAVSGLVEAISRDVLRAERAGLLLRDRIPGLPAFIGYSWGAVPPPALADLPDDPDRRSLRLDSADGNPGAAEWAIPLRDSRGLAGALLLGPPLAGSVYSEELMEVAAACCARLTDALAGERAARMLGDVLRQRIAEVKLIGSQQRRTLHDDVLPQIHAALIHLSALQGRDPAAEQAIGALSSAHSQLSRMIRALPPATPLRLEHAGLLGALRDLATVDFGAAFDQMDWAVEPGVAERLTATPQFVGEVVCYAAQEALRNVARHARGADSRRPLQVAVRVAWRRGLQIDIEDNGVGVAQAEENGSAGIGSRLHRSLLAVLGGAWQTLARDGGGTMVRLSVPEDLWILPALTGEAEHG